MSPAIMSPGDWATLALLGLIWGGSFFLIAVAVTSLPPLTIVLLRVAIAAIALWGVCRATGVAVPISREMAGPFLAIGLFNNVIPFSLIVWGQREIASGLASILNATTPLFTVVVAHIATADEKLTGAKLAGIAAGLLGIAVMFAPAIGAGTGIGIAGTQESIPAQLAILGAALSYGIAAVFGRRFARMGVAPMATAAGQLAASSLILAPFWLLFERPWMLPAPSAAAVVSVVGLALACTALAYVLYFRLLARAGATNVSLVTFLVPVSAILLGAIFLGEELAPRHYGGMALIFAGLAVLDGRLASALRPRHS
jgi:drug/metabolite transporter (DMT)-like permease